MCQCQAKSASVKPYSRETVERSTASEHGQSFALSKIVQVALRNLSPSRREVWWELVVAHLVSLTRHPEVISFA